MTLDVKKTFESYDGKSVDPFRSVAEMLPATPGVLKELTGMAAGGSDAVEVGSTWVIKKLLEDGVDPPASTGSRIVRLLGTLRSNDAILHVLQALPYLSLNQRDRTTLHSMLKPLVSTDNKFVRAWAYNGYAVLAKGDSAYRKETLKLFERAMKQESAAVKARIRNASKDLR